MNTVKATTVAVADGDGNVLWVGAVVPGRMHDQTAVKRAGIDALLDNFGQVGVLVDAGYRGLARDHRGQVAAPPLKPRKGATGAQLTDWEQQRKTQSSARITVEHANARVKAWRTVRRWDGRRDAVAETFAAVGVLASLRTTG